MVQLSSLFLPPELAKKNSTPPRQSLTVEAITPNSGSKGGMKAATARNGPLRFPGVNRYPKWMVKTW